MHRTPVALDVPRKGLCTAPPRARVPLDSLEYGVILPKVLAFPWYSYSWKCSSDANGTADCNAAHILCHCTMAYDVVRLPLPLPLPLPLHLPLPLPLRLRLYCMHVCRVAVFVFVCVCVRGG